MINGHRIIRFGQLFFALLSSLGLSFSAQALDLDWSGMFRAESHFIFNYTLDPSNTLSDAARAGQGGYYIPGGGKKDAQFQMLFMKLNPIVVVNDNVYIKSEWWVGNPVYGFFGGGSPQSFDQRQYYSTFSRGSVISAQRVWGELLTDLGTVQVGRVPLHWGLGIVWNSGGNAWDRYASTGDGMRVISKFGAFSFIPSVVMYSKGNNIGGACLTPSGVTPPARCSGSPGSGAVNDYSLILKYDNPDEDIELGLNFIKRIGGYQQDTSGYLGADGTASGMNYNIWGIFGRKKLGPVTISAEVPIVDGSIGNATYGTYAAAGEVKWDITRSWEVALHGGHAPGQKSIAGNTPTEYSAFYFNPNYRLAMMMFNYQFANFAGPNTTNNPATTSANLMSPFDNPIVNTTYLSLGGKFRIGKWEIRNLWALATAHRTAGGDSLYNTWDRKFYTYSGMPQENFMGWEVDLGTTYSWDDAFKFHTDLGFHMPGAFYKFSNTATENGITPVWGFVVKADVLF